MLTKADIDRLIMLVTVADYDGDTELKHKLDKLRKLAESREFVNRSNPS